MNTNQEELTIDLEEEKLLVQLKNVNLEDVGKGRLSLTSKRIEFDHKSSFLSSPSVELSLDLAEISSVSIKDASNTLVLEWYDENGEHVTSHLSLPESDASTQLYRLLSKKLRVLRQLADLQERRASFQAFLWQTAYQTWVLSGIVLRIIRALTKEDWDTVDDSVNEARQISRVLSSELALDISDEVHALSEAVSIRDAPLVLRNVMATIKSIGGSLNGDPPFGEEWADLALEDTPGLNWRDVRYIFLFASWHNLLSLWQETGETEKIEGLLPRLVTLLSLLADRISRRSQLGIASLSENGSNIADSVELAARNLDTMLKTNAGVA